MDELTLRLVLIGAALLVAAGVTTLTRRRARTAPRSIESTGLRPGVYFFSSSTCPDCRMARRALDEAIRDSSFHEFAWEENPGIFADLGVAAVPATLVVGADGTGTLWSGQPAGALASLGP